MSWLSDAISDVTGFIFGKPPKDRSAEVARQQEEERQRRIAAGKQRIDEIFAGFNDEFFDTAQNNYLNYYMPQLDDQFGRAREKTTAGLYRTGQIQGSSGARTMADLFKDYNTRAQAIADAALNQRSQLKTNTESNKADLIAQLEGGAGVDTIAQSAAARAAALTQPQPYSPLADLFSQYTGMYALNKQAQGQGYRGLQSPLFGGGGNKSVDVVGG